MTLVIVLLYYFLILLSVQSCFLGERFKSLIAVLHLYM